ncbi:MAG: TonB-dependent receptor [Bacteroidota bacterium]
MKKYVKYSIALLFMYMLNSSTVVMSQDTLKLENLLDLSLAELMELNIISTSKIQEKLTESPASIYIITKQEIKLRGYLDLKDVLRDIPSFDYISNGGVGNITEFIVRGVNEGTSNVLVFRDGIKISNPGNITLPFGNQMPLHNVERIEVIVGPSSVIYGQDTYSGLINIITDHKTQNELQLGGGSYETFSPSGFVNFKLKKGYIFLSGRSFISKGYDLYKLYPEIYKDDIDSLKVKIPNWQDKFDENDMGTNAFKRDYNFHVEMNLKKITVGVIHSRINEAKTGFTPKRYLTNHNTSIDIKSTQFYSIHNDTLSPRLFLKTKFLINNHQTGNDYKNTYAIPQYNGDTLEPAGVVKYFYYINTSSSLEEQFVYTPTSKILLNTGAIAEYISSTPLSENYFEPKNTDEELAVYRFTNFGAFLQGTYSFNARNKLIVGGRLDKNSSYGFVPTYRAALVLSPISKINFKLLYGKAYREPTVRQLYGVNIIDISVDIGNPALKPETINTYELVFNYEKSRNLNLVTNLYYNHSPDIIQQKMIGIDDIGRKIMQNQNINSLKTYGTEMSMKYNIIKSLTAELWYCYLNGQYTVYDDMNNSYVSKEISQISRNKINLGLTYILMKKMGFYLNTHWVDKISTTTGNSEFFGEPMKGYTNLDLNISYLGQKLEVGFMINNLLNQKYYHAGPNIQSGSYVTKVPQPLQNYFIKISYHI